MPSAGAAGYPVTGAVAGGFPGTGDDAEYVVLSPWTLRGRGGKCGGVGESLIEDFPFRIDCRGLMHSGLDIPTS